jgi:uncharacterized membrane protein
MDATRDIATEETQETTHPPGPAHEERPPMALADLIGGRVLAWIGGVAVAIGLVLLAVMASAGHHLGVPERLGLAGLGSLVLMGAGVWLHERRGQTEASIVAVGAATVAMFVILAVAAHTATIPAVAAIAGSLFVGGLAVGLARRWAGQAIGWLGLLGAVAAPTAAGGLLDATALVLLAVALVCLLAIAVWQRWTWLAFAGLLLAMAQWGWWCVHSTSVPAQILVLSTFTGLGLAAALAQRLVHRGDAIDPVTVLLVAVNALAAGALGRVLLGSAGSPVAGDIWLAAVGAVHLALGSMRRLRLGVELRALLLAVGFVLVDVAFSLAFSGIVLSLGWAATAVGFAWLRRRLDDRADTDAASRFSVIDTGTGVHIALVLVRVLLATGDTGVVPVVGTVALAIACLTGGWLAAPRRATVADVLNGLGLAAIAYLTAQSLHGEVLVVAWAAEAVALAQLARRAGAQPWRAQILRGESVAFLLLALGHVLLVEAPPTVLVDGSPAFGAVAIALAALAAGAIRAGLASPRAGAWRPWLLIGGAAAALYLLSAGIITLFQPVLGAVGQFGGGLVALSIRQQGQVVLSIVWGVIGLGGVVVGLRRRQDIVRNVALGLLLIAVTKVFAYDLSTLTSVYRVASLVGFGALLLLSAFAYQRLRPGAHRVRG